uniref:Mitochondrial import inner membrane translocase subunit TIM22 n=1 Tax=Neobodo designis TaxID=312471 RepID=A0A7S1KWR3_NEODS|mmetsp:Transcript_10376/g.32145  ORF Transcript_10376/g.32145 Transcript_10376/m.32145 type:complete len:154 (+) Transcript_10376:168-629(+)|eukprot:CAMPEP_0174856324 /NCGR_PEP_ID=MMETSP1114-20130205/35662_1 /TAXON_ID=312471 /ORGANISM="Neobodo designis, Strain CCAP 1951/1" /LENGTH=153 /DNA_ID=CAMNT_0016091119 /DNA_START=166 /DNA_END=627 /DNA_ORIENTATION=+
MALSLLETQPPTEPMQEAYTFLRDSTLGVAVPGIVGGYIMGGAFSLFGSMISAETSTQAMGTRDFFKYSLRSAHRLGRSFAYIGVLFGGMEVALEKRRGRKDVWNITVAGAAIGGYWGYKSYRRPGFVGGVIGGAAFSIVTERMMEALGMGQH